MDYQLAIKTRFRSGQSYHFVTYLCHASGTLLNHLFQNIPCFLINQNMFPPRIKQKTRKISIADGQPYEVNPPLQIQSSKLSAKNSYAHTSFKQVSNCSSNAESKQKEQIHKIKTFQRNDDPINCIGMYLVGVCQHHANESQNTIKQTEPFYPTSKYVQNVCQKIS